MKEESFKRQMTCPRCGNAGEGTIFGSHNPADPEHVARRVETLPKGMAGGPIDENGDQIVLCERCGSGVTGR